MTKPHRIWIGPWEISNMIITMGEALREGGYEVETLFIDAPFQHFYAANPYDDRVRWPVGDRFRRAPRDRTRFNLQMARRLLRAIRRFDTFVFVWRYSFLPLQLDLPLLRALGKRVIVFYCGDDVRYKPIQVEIDRRRGYRPWPPADTPEFAKWMSWGRTFFEGYWSVKLAEKTGCHIVAARDTATFQGRTWSGFMMPQRMLVDAPRAPADEPLIVHAPTNRELKGTRHVEGAIAQLRDEGLRFRFRLIEGMPVEELEDVLPSADIVIDQPGVWLGRLGIMAIAAGAAVVGGNRAGYWHVPPPSPVQQFEPDAERLAATLRPLVIDQARRGELMRESFEYARDVYSYEAFVRFFEALADGEQPYPIEPLADQREVVRDLAPGPLERAAVSLVW